MPWRVETSRNNWYSKLKGYVIGVKNDSQMYTVAFVKPHQLSCP